MRGVIACIAACCIGTVAHANEPDFAGVKSELRQLLADGKAVKIANVGTIYPKIKSSCHMQRGFHGSMVMSCRYKANKSAPVVSLSSPDSEAFGQYLHHKVSTGQYVRLHKIGTLRNGLHPKDRRSHFVHLRSKKYSLMDDARS